MLKGFLGVFLLAGCLVASFPRPIYAQSQCPGDFVCDEALVKVSRLLSPRDFQEILSDHGAVILDRYPHLRLYHIAFQEGGDTLENIASLSAEPGILRVSPNWTVHAQLLPNDPSFGLLWGMDNNGQTGGVPGVDVGMESFWDQATDCSNVTVAVIDTGIDYNHPDLASNIWTNPGEIPDNGVDDDGNGFIDDVHGYDFRNHDGDPMDDHRHGTHVAGTIAAVGNNGTGVSGMCWTAKIMAVKFLSASASGTISDAIAGIEYAVANGAAILNNSWGGGGFDSGLLAAILDSDAVGTIFTAAAGNNGADIDVSPFYPAAYDSPNVVSVASIHQDDGLSSFSNYGNNNVDLGAPGSEIYSTLRNGTYGYMSGTSMATPHVSGAAALLWSNFPALSHRQIIQILFQSVAPKDYMVDTSSTDGILNLPNAYALASDPTNQAPVANAGGDQTAAVGDTVQLQGSATDGDGDFPLIFEWELTVPTGSQSGLDDPFGQTPTFVPDQLGDYTATLKVYDLISSSLPDAAVIHVDSANVPPPTVIIHGTGFDPETQKSVELGSGIPTEVGRPVTLDGSDSDGVFPYLLVFEWSLVEEPLGAVTTLNDPGNENIQYVPDVAGTYTLRLTVEDGFNESFAEFSFVASEVQPASEPPAGPQGPGGTTADPTGGKGCSLNRDARSSPSPDLRWGMPLYFILLLYKRRKVSLHT